MRFASIQMYANFAPLRQATDDLWAFVRDQLRAKGLDGVPDGLSWNSTYHDAWLDPDLLLSQTCGYPYVSRLQGRVRLVATPEYEYPGCSGADMRSFAIVRDESRFDSVSDAKSMRVAINQLESNSGYNLLRALIAPHADQGRFFSSVLHTGSHDASLAAVRNGGADIAAIDCITFGNIAQFDPKSIDGIRILAETPVGPGLPFITRSGASDEEVALLRDALSAAIASPALGETRRVLSLKNFHVLDDDDYARLKFLDDRAGRLGYPRIN
ncbi:phosphate/phosphite/phosphonate ABC transporter substrate-binding protein [Rhizobium multihospitium]|uniref:ABC-type phosphate/phosphonate transport system, substrate-binding protein n=1 Tax=Rhizobium multihospitium TaxID=410764 RepID=A0A1C3WWD9_9HYPH|nr:PhnD/SsuA/transferrin family substrate-binding protein [Rhizobium multihospitium]SCB44186.1 ABC-type phosphate/phosphonate transport system, substrate-binding protein [Rhizobium multihospitium]